MSAPKNEQDEAVDWDYDKMTKGVNVKFPPLDSDDLPHNDMDQHDLKRFRNVWNKHSRHWDVHHKIDFLDYLWNLTATHYYYPWEAFRNPLYSERSKFPAYVILKCLYPNDCNLPPHRFIRWGKYLAIDGDELQVTDWDGNSVDDWGYSESPAQGNQWSSDDVEAFNKGVRNSAQDEPDESLKTKNRATAQCQWGDASLSPALDQQNDNNADGPFEEVVMPGTWIPSRPSPDPLGEDDQHYQRQESSEWGSNDEKCAWSLSAANRTYAASDLESVRSKGMTLQETSAEDDSVYSERGNPYLPKQSGRPGRRACRGHNAFASKFSSETEDSELGVITPASSNAGQAPALSGQQIQELKDFITKTNDNTVAQLSLEMSHMKKSLDEKIERMREDFNLRLNRAMKANRSLRDDMESLQLSLPDDATTRQQVRVLEAKVATLEHIYQAF